MNKLQIYSIQSRIAKSVRSAISFQKGKALCEKVRPVSYFRKYVEKVSMNSALNPAGDLRKISKTINSCHSVWYVRQSTLHNSSGQLEKVVFLTKT